MTESAETARSAREVANPFSLALPGTILAHVDTGTSTDALLPAADLAERSGAALLGVAAEGFKAAWVQGYGFIEGSVMAQLMDDLRARLEATRARFADSSARLADRARLVVEEAMPRDAMVRHACAADWIVAARPTRDQDPSVYPSASDLFMDSGLPVLLSPGPDAPLRAHRIVVGWKNTREARRAVAAALPLLVKAEDVVLAQIETDGPDAPQDSSLEEACSRLTVHGCRARPVRVARRDRQALSAAIESVMIEHDADLLVVGGYAHSRVQEWVLGGMTRELLDDFPCWILFAH